MRLRVPDMPIGIGHITPGVLTSPHGILVVGGVISLAENMHSSSSQASVGTFVTFIVLMLVGSGLCCLLEPVSRVLRADADHQNDGDDYHTFSTPVYYLLSCISHMRRHRAP